MKKGNRIVVYATLDGTPARSPGTVLKVEKDRVWVRIERKQYREIWAHPKQCRQLRKVKK